MMAADRAFSHFSEVLLHLSFLKSFKLEKFLVFPCFNLVEYRHVGGLALRIMLFSVDGMRT